EKPGEVPDVLDILEDGSGDVNVHPVGGLRGRVEVFVGHLVEELGPELTVTLQGGRNCDHLHTMCSFPADAAVVLTDEEQLVLSGNHLGYVLGGTYLELYPVVGLESVLGVVLVESVRQVPQGIGGIVQQG